MKISERNIIIISIAALVLIALCILSSQKIQRENDLSWLQQEKGKIEKGISGREILLVELVSQNSCDLPIRIKQIWLLAKYEERLDDLVKPRQIKGGYCNHYRRKKFSYLDQKFIVRTELNTSDYKGEPIRYGVPEGHIFNIRTKINKDITVFFKSSGYNWSDYHGKIEINGKCPELTDEQKIKIIALRDEILNQAIEKEKIEVQKEIFDLNVKLSKIDQKILAINAEINAEIGL